MKRLSAQRGKKLVVNAFALIILIGLINNSLGFADSDAVINSSISEGMSNVIMEAMALGIGTVTQILNIC